MVGPPRMNSTAHRMESTSKEEIMRRRLFPGIAAGVILACSAALFAQAAGEKKSAAKKNAKEAAPAAMKFIASDDAPKAIGPYSQAVVEGGFLFAAGQIPLDPKSGELGAGGIEPSAERVLDNLEAVLKAAGLTFADVVKTTVFLTKAEDFAA